MKNEVAYPLTFDQRFPDILKEKIVSENHAAPISFYCSQCGESLGYLPFTSDICQHCKTIIDWTCISIPDKYFPNLS